MQYFCRKKLVEKVAPLRLNRGVITGNIGLAQSIAGSYHRNA